MNNLYIINKILSDYTDGMAVIAAPSLERCRELFLEEFGRGWCPFMDEFDSAIEDGEYKVFEAANASEGIISYVFGGG